MSSSAGHTGVQTLPKLNARGAPEAQEGGSPGGKGVCPLVLQRGASTTGQSPNGRTLGPRTRPSVQWALGPQRDLWGATLKHPQ